ncbi:uncharacterized protein LOC126379501 isoform X2 [Pectinophora gossypiella]|uniref:uncharacterized protein LOC126379501 isoform X2 n=1 Tax=Pectinophora gossypiella TaxID=13191 RepID=UPI00214F1D5B|nr:uncharacterized protein LOC126379501 isoform X2 [Pectinophora gossypiella]
MFKLSAACKNLRCPPVSKPICVQLVYHKVFKPRAPVYVMMINKCEMKYINCYQGIDAVQMPMAHCDHNLNKTKSDEKNKLKTKYAKEKEIATLTDKRGKPRLKRSADQEQLESRKQILKKNDQPRMVGLRTSIPKIVRSRRDISTPKTINHAILSKKQELQHLDKAKAAILSSKPVVNKSTIKKVKTKQQKLKTKQLKLKSLKSSDKKSIRGKNKRFVKLNEGNKPKKLKRKIWPKRKKRPKPKITIPPVDIYTPAPDYQKSVLYNEESQEEVISQEKTDTFYTIPDFEENTALDTNEDEPEPANVEPDEVDEPPPTEEPVEVEELPDTGEDDYVYTVEDTTDDIDMNEYNSTCPNMCPAKAVMVCAKCKDNNYRTFLSICYMRVFNCKHPEEGLQLVARRPCAMSAPFLGDLQTPKGLIEEPGDYDVILKYFKCKDQDWKKLRPWSRLNCTF